MKRFYRLAFGVALFAHLSHAAGPAAGAVDCFKKAASKIDDRAAAILCNHGGSDVMMKCFQKLEPDYDDVAVALVCVDGSSDALKCFSAQAEDSDDLAAAMLCTHSNVLILTESVEQ